MADVRGAAAYDEMQPVLMTFNYDGTIVFDPSHYNLSQGSAQVGKAVALVAGGQVGLGAVGGFAFGKLIKVESDFCTVQVAGSMGLPYLAANANPPLPGRGVQVDGTGLVISPAGGVRLATERGIVLKLDTVNQIAFTWMP